MARRTRLDATTALLTGLVVGLLGSFADDLLGASTVTDVVQIVLWVASAVLIAFAVAGMARAGGGTSAPHARPR